MTKLTPTQFAEWKARNKMPDYVIGGHSHAYAFGLPPKEREAPCELVTISGDLDGVVGGWPRTRKYWNTLAEAGRERTILLSWCGNCPVTHFIFEGNPAFDFLLGSDPLDTILQGRKAVPETLIRHVLGIHAKPLQEVLALLKQHTERVILICPPPPKGTSPAARALMRRERYFADKLAVDRVDFSEVNLIPESVLLKAWRLMRDMQSEAAALTSSTFLSFPIAGMTESGFLAPQYWANDYTHANAACGDLLLKEIKNAL